MTADTWRQHWQAFRADAGELPAKDLEAAWIHYAAAKGVPLRMPTGTEVPSAPKRRGRPPKQPAQG
jgi:hypothetical protein